MDTLRDRGLEIQPMQNPGETIAIHFDVIYYQEAPKAGLHLMMAFGSRPELGKHVVAGVGEFICEKDYYTFRAEDNGEI